MAALVIFYDIWAGLGVLAIALLAKFSFCSRCDGKLFVVYIDSDWSCDRKYLLACCNDGLVRGKANIHTMRTITFVNYYSFLFAPSIHFKVIQSGNKRDLP